MEDISFNLQNILQIKRLPLSDAELLDINCNYKNYSVCVNLKLDSPGKSNVKAQLNLSGVKLINIPIYEPWGAGMYINEVMVEAKDEDLLFNINILLNSGDIILIIADKLIYSEL